MEIAIASASGFNAPGSNIGARARHSRRNPMVRFYLGRALIFTQSTANIYYAYCIN